MIITCWQVTSIQPKVRPIPTPAQTPRDPVLILADTSVWVMTQVSDLSRICRCAFAGGNGADQSSEALDSRQAVARGGCRSGAGARGGRYRLKQFGAAVAVDREWLGTRGHPVLQRKQDDARRFHGPRIKRLLRSPAWDPTVRVARCSIGVDMSKQRSGISTTLVHSEP